MTTPTQPKGEPIALPPLPEPEDGQTESGFAIYNAFQMDAYARAAIADRERLAVAAPVAVAAEPVAWVDSHDLSEGRSDFMACSNAEHGTTKMLRYDTPLYGRASTVAPASQTDSAYYLWEHSSLPSRVARVEDADFSHRDPDWARCYPIEVWGGAALRAGEKPASCLDRNVQRVCSTTHAPTVEASASSAVERVAHIFAQQNGWDGVDGAPGWLVELALDVAAALTAPAAAPLGVPAEAGEVARLAEALRALMHVRDFHPATRAKEDVVRQCASILASLATPTVAAKDS